MQMKRDTSIKPLKNRNCYWTVFSITAISLQYEFLSPTQEVYDGFPVLKEKKSFRF